MKKMPVKKKVGVKKLENRPKSGREIVFLPVKKSKKRQKMAFTGTFFFTGKKKTLTHTPHPHQNKKIIFGVKSEILIKYKNQMDP